jgi:hypothetical protein
MVKGVLAAIEGTVDSLTRQSILFFFGLRWHYGGLCDSEPCFHSPKPLFLTSVWKDIHFSPTARSIFNDRLQNAHLFGQSVRRNCQARSNL